jgi:dinuclear metal center YbgI/SA1388 family protein
MEQRTSLARIGGTDVITTISDVVAWLEEFAPSRLAESWDNVGLLWGDPVGIAERVMTCLTITPATAAEAIEAQASLIVSHHPVLLREVKRIRADLVETGQLWKLARAGVAIASPHTAFDNTRDGINDILCQRLGLLEVSPLRPRSPVALATASRPAAALGPESFKVVVFTPESDCEAVLSAAFHAGAGQIGAYRECSFAIPGRGTFFGGETTNPSVGRRGQREVVDELRLEVVCPAGRLADVLSAIRARHSYEEPAIDVYPLHTIVTSSTVTPPGAGRIGRLVDGRGLAELAGFVGGVLGSMAVQVVGDGGRIVSRVAVACGAGDEFVQDAARAGAEVLITGEARFHRGVEAESLGVALIMAGHYATERLGVEHLAQRIAVAFPSLSVWPSQTERDPFHIVGSLASGGPTPALVSRPRQR